MSQTGQTAGSILAELLRAQQRGAPETDLAAMRERLRQGSA